MAAIAGDRTVSSSRAGLGDLADRPALAICLSATLHALAAAWIMLSPRPASAPAPEATPVEIWTAAEVAALAPPARPAPAPSPPAPSLAPTPDAASPPASIAPPPAAAPPRPQIGDTILATAPLSAAVLAHPRSRATLAFLNRLQLDERLEQLCNIEAMAQISHHFPDLPANRVIAYATAATSASGDRFIAKGAAFHTKNAWTRMSYTCRHSRDRRTILAFEFTIGEAIPRSDWAALNLPFER